MASPEKATETSDLTFPATNVEKDLSVQNNKSLEVDPISSEVATSLEIEQQAEVEQKEKDKKKKKDALQTLKTTILVSAVIVAVAGVVFAVTKKLREK
ncbi:uncharacterized protein LOC112010822 [Quercus suber]|uniref:Uncharacterized protein n=1 Tax=Quercus suber TaxID=58331 RepID=A0AAW0M4W7_QUESU|nr:uncharacterized protein LOC112010822 [Quercus suber]POE52642.1 hypothetical protein CFP56_35092 [Quercus suber]